MNESNDFITKISDAERVEQLLKANSELQAELVLERQQLVSAQQQLSAMSQQLSTLMNAGTEPMLPVGEHYFDVAKIAALTWDRSEPNIPKIRVDGIAVWQPANSRPALMSTLDVDPQERAALPARLEAWEEECQAAMAEFLIQLSAAKEELKSRRRR